MKIVGLLITSTNRLPVTFITFVYCLFWDSQKILLHIFPFYCGMHHSLLWLKNMSYQMSCTNWPLTPEQWLLVEFGLNVMAHGDAREGKWRGNWWMEWVVSTCHTTSEHGVSPLLPLMCTPRLPVGNWTDAPADSNGLIDFTKRRNLVSVHVPSCFKCSLPVTHHISGSSVMHIFSWSGYCSHELLPFALLLWHLTYSNRDKCSGGTFGFHMQGRRVLCRWR